MCAATPKGEWLGGSPNDWWGEIHYPKLELKWNTPRKVNKVLIKRLWAYDDLLPDYRRVAEAAHAKGKKVFLPVHPGHDNSGFRPDDFFVIPRDEGATLREYLRAATDARADAILVTSFNEWPETTVVEPSSTWADPYQYLKILAEWKGIPFVTPARMK